MNLVPPHLDLSYECIRINRLKLQTLYVCSYLKNPLIPALSKK